jgi:hypothetical protein
MRPSGGGDIEFRFICGIKTNVQVVLAQTPREFRGTQRNIADHVRLDGWLVTVPELYAEDASTSRANDDVSLRTWDSASVGTTRLPVGLLRLVEQVVEPRSSGWTGWASGRQLRDE